MATVKNFNPKITVIFVKHRWEHCAVAVFAASGIGDLKTKVEWQRRGKKIYKSARWAKMGVPKGKGKKHTKHTLKVVKESFELALLEPHGEPEDCAIKPKTLVELQVILSRGVVKNSARCSPMIIRHWTDLKMPMRHLTKYYYIY